MYKRQHSHTTVARRNARTNNRASCAIGSLLKFAANASCMEQIDYHLLFRWFVAFPVDGRVWNHSTFTKNRDRLLERDIARCFFAQVPDHAGPGTISSRTSAVA